MLKIYKIQYDSFYYIGSSSLDLSHRLYLHKCHSKKYPNRKIYKTIQNWDIATICLIDEGDTDTENLYICLEDPFCLNTRKSVPPNLKEYYKKYRQTQIYKDYQKKYRHEHRQQYNEYQRLFRLRRSAVNIQTGLQDSATAL